MRRLAAPLLVLLAALIGAGSASAAGWDRVETPTYEGKAHVYQEAAAFGQDSAWAAGYTYGLLGSQIEFRTLISRWNGSSWSLVQTPNRETAPARNFLFDVSASGPASAWAVGFSSTGIGNPAPRPLVLRWDGVRWSFADGPASFAGALTTVAAAPDGTVVIAGEGRNLQTLYAIPRVWLRDGVDWRDVAFPPVPGCARSQNGLMTRAQLTDVASRGPRTTWATGYCAVPEGGERGFLVRFNGARWLPVLTPDELTGYGPRGQLTGVSISPDGDVWAVGWGDDFGVGARPIAFRGRHATVRAVPAPGQGNGAVLYAVATERGGAAIAAGIFTRPTDSAPHPHLLGADALGGLAIEPAEQSTVGNLYGVALLSGGTAWAVGVSSSDDRGLIMQRTP